MREFVLKQSDDLTSEEQEIFEINDYYDVEYRTFLFEKIDDKLVRLIHVDGGEPEDQTFTRDWYWVETELNKLVKEVEELKKSK